MKKSPSTLVSAIIALLIGIIVGILGHAAWSDPSIEVIASEDKGDRIPEVQEAAKAKVREDEARTAKVELEAKVPGDSGRKVLAPGVDSDLGVIVYGTVRDEEGKLVDPASVGFTSKTPGEPAIYTLVKNGGYSQHGMKPGSWNTLVQGEGLKNKVGKVDIPARPLFRCDFVVSRAYIVTVRAKTPKGEPLMKALREAKFYRVALNAVATRTDLVSVPMTDLRYHRVFGIGKWSDLRFTMRSKGLADEPEVLGLLELSSSPPAYVSLMLKHHILAQKQVLPGQKEVSFEISVDAIAAQTATVRLRVIDRTTRQPIAKARVGISDRQSGAGGLPTGEDGTIVLKHQATGLMEIDINAKGRESYHANLRLEAGEVDLGTIELGPPLKLHGIVQNAAGQPQAASITWTNLENRTFPQPLNHTRSLTADSKGNFELGRLGLGRYLLQARIRNKSLATRVIDTGKLAAEPIRLILQPTLPVTVDNTRMSALRRLTILIRDSQRRLVSGWYLTSPYRITIRLPSGSYNFEVFEKRKRLQTGSIKVSPGKVPTILVRA